MRTYFQGDTYLVEFSDADTTCFVRHTDADPAVVYGSGAFVFDSRTGDFVCAKGSAKNHGGNLMWLAFSQDAQDYGRSELARQGFEVNPFDFCPHLEEIAHNPKKGHAYEGRRVELVHMSDPFTHLRSGATGVVTHVDDLGTIFVLWDDGTRLGIVPGEDHFQFVAKDNPSTTTISRTRGVKTMPGPYPAKRGYQPWISRKGKLGKGFLTSMSKKQREEALDECVRADGYRSCLSSIMVLERARRGPRGVGEGVGSKYADKLASSREYLRGKYGGAGSFGPREARRGERAAEAASGYRAAVGNPEALTEDEEAFTDKLESLETSKIWENLYHYVDTVVGVEFECDRETVDKDPSAYTKRIADAVRSLLDEAMADEESADQQRFGGRGWGKWQKPTWRSKIETSLYLPPASRGKDGVTFAKVEIDVPYPKNAQNEAFILRALLRLDQSLDQLQGLCAAKPKKAAKAAKTRKKGAAKAK